MTRTVRMPWVQGGDEGLEDVPGYRRIDNITNWCLQQFRAKYLDLQITKDDIWHYIYGLLPRPRLPAEVPRRPVQRPAPHSLRSGLQRVSEMPASSWRRCTWGMRPVRSMSCRWK